MKMMRIGFGNAFEKKNFSLFIKWIVIIVFFIFIGKNVITGNLERYFTTEDYIIRNDAVKPTDNNTGDASLISQYFSPKASRLSKVYFYYTGNTKKEEEFGFRILDEDGIVIFENQYRFEDFKENRWEVLDIHLNGLVIGKSYIAEFNKQSSHVSFIFMDSNVSSIYGDCLLDNELQKKIVSIGFLFHKKYITVGDGMHMVLMMVCAIFLVLTLSYGLLKLKEIYHIFKIRASQSAALFALFFSGHLVFFFNPIDEWRTGVTTFGREIGQGLLTGYDADRVIGNFTIWFLLFVISFSIYYLVSNYILYKFSQEENEKVIFFSRRLVFLGIIDLLLRGLTLFYDDSKVRYVLNYSTAMIFILIVCSIVYIIANYKEILTAVQFYQIILMCFILGFPVSIFTSIPWEEGALLIGVQTILITFAMIGLRIGLGSIISKGDEKTRESLIVVLSALPLVTSFYIEAVNVLNQYHIFISDPKLGYVVIVLFIVIASMGSLYFSLKGKWSGEWKNWSYILLIIGIVCLNQQLQLENIVAPDIFEWANFSVNIEGFFNRGEIPIVEHLGHHMLSGIWGGLFYGIINQDYHGAIVSPYSSYIAVIYVLLFYLFLKKILEDETMAFFSTLLIPFYNSWEYYAWGVLIIFATLGVIEKKTVWRMFLFWLSVVWCCLNRADVGFAFGQGGVLVLLISIFKEKDWKLLKKMGITFVQIAVGGSILWFILCAAKGVNPVVRFIEFFKLYDATINWTYPGIGDHTSTLFVIGYLVVPFFILVGLLYLIFLKEKRNEIGKETWVIMLSLGLSYIFNFSRALQRHSLMEMATTVVFWTAFPFISLFVNKMLKQRYAVILYFMLGIVINSIFLSNKAFSAEPFINSATGRVGGLTESWTKKRDTGIIRETYWQEIARRREKKQRIHYTVEFTKSIEPYKYLIEKLLNSDETFLDFMYDSYIYAEFKKPDPVYIVQSPVELSGEYTQELFIEQLRSKQDLVPIAFLPNSVGYHSTIDSIMLNYKYYKVSEYLYQHYRPLCTLERVSVWCLNERYDEMRNVLEQNNELSQSQEFTLIEWGYDDVLHTYQLDKLPIIWGELDQKKAVDNPVVSETLLDHSGIYKIKEPSIYEKHKSAYLKLTGDYIGKDMDGLIDEEDEFTPVSLILGNYDGLIFRELYKFEFKMKEDMHNYLFRISSDYHWQIGNVNAVRLDAMEKVEGVNIQILEGD